VTKELLPFDEAFRRVMDAVPVPEPEPVALDASIGRILARDVRADRDIPPFDRATLDGYAVRVRGRFGPSRRLPVVGEVAAGALPPSSLRMDSCVRIWTGAGVPRGAQGVIPVEKAREATGWVHLEGPLAPTKRRRPGIAERGEDARRGSTLLALGERITPASVAVLAAVGQSRVSAYREPALAIVVTGHEIVPPECRPGRVQIRSTNDAVVAAAAASVGVRSVRRLGIVEDDEAPLRRILRRGLEEDILIVTGGVSAGRFDLVPAVLKDLGVRILFHKVAIRPGKPFLFGIAGAAPRKRRRPGSADRPADRRGAARHRPTFVFGLPGNPVSALVTAVEFLIPFLRAWRGEDPVRGAPVAVRLERPIRRSGGLTHFVPCALRVDGAGTLWAREIPLHGSGDFVSASRADALLRVPGDGLEKKAGSLLLADAIDRSR
jgi:molybdopterin molybdotransferase